MSEVDSNEVLVSFRGVQKSYDGENLIVKDLNLEIRKGEFLTLLGPSGSGKTTSLMMLAGFETPTAGEIQLAGRSINNVPPHKRDIGMVFQNYALFPHMTVAENLAFPLSVRGLSKTDISERVKRVLSMVQLDAFAQRYPAQLSGGQQQRVASRVSGVSKSFAAIKRPNSPPNKNLICKEAQHESSFFVVVQTSCLDSDFMQRAV